MSDKTLEDQKKDLQARKQDIFEVLKPGELEVRLQEIQGEMNEPSFWENQARARELSKELDDIRGDLEVLTRVEEGLSGLDDMLELAKEDAAMHADLEQSFTKLEADLAQLEKKTYFQGEMDVANAIVSFHAGAGGTDAQDWTDILRRMILRFAESQDYDAELIDESPGEEAGLKSATIAVRGRFAFGHLKSESGVHRLVRISPFDAEGMRHTAFALIEVIPELTELNESKVEIDPSDLRIDTFMASGKGGQSVNTTYSAVRITHIPTNTVVSCQNERSQQQNKETAMKVLKSRLFQQMLEARAEKISELKGEHRKVEWGSQIRSYVMHPYKMVKDHRTKEETQDIDAVLNGGIMPFIEAYLKQQAAE